MAKRQDSGGDPAPENKRPTSRDEDAIPEMTDNVRGRADEEDEEFEDTDEDSDMEDLEEEGDEGNF